MFPLFQEEWSYRLLNDLLLFHYFSWWRSGDNRTYVLCHARKRWLNLTLLNSSYTILEFIWSYQCWFFNWRISVGWAFDKFSKGLRTSPYRRVSAYRAIPLTNRYTSYVPCSTPLSLPLHTRLSPHQWRTSLRCLDQAVAAPGAQGETKHRHISTRKIRNAQEICVSADVFSVLVMIESHSISIAKLLRNFVH